MLDDSGGAYFLQSGRRRHRGGQRGKESSAVHSASTDQLIASAVTAERERCAQVARDWYQILERAGGSVNNNAVRRVTCREIAAQILRPPSAIQA